jgi:glucokinase
MILAGDIGGTNTRLALFELNEFELNRQVFDPIVEENFSSRDHVDLGVIIQKFRVTYPLPITQACFGVAGSVKHGRCEATNLPWVVDAQVLAHELGLTRIGLINDLEANAIGIAALKLADFISLNLGEPDAEGNAALISAGTVLGRLGFSGMVYAIARSLQKADMQIFHPAMSLKWTCYAIYWLSSIG